jgi:hypothetical protein
MEFVAREGSATRDYKNFDGFDLPAEAPGANVKKALSALILTVCFYAAAFAQKGSFETAPPISADEFASDGCTWFPDGNYRDCCVAHDLEYYAGGNWKARWRSDKKLFLCVARKSKLYNKLVAPAVWLGVRAGGVSWLKARFSWGFGKKKKYAEKVLKRRKIQS